MQGEVVYQPNQIETIAQAFGLADLPVAEVENNGPNASRRDEIERVLQTLVWGQERKDELKAYLGSRPSHPSIACINAAIFIVAKLEKVSDTA